MNPVDASAEPEGSANEQRCDLLVVTDRRFWRRSKGSEQRIATLVLFLSRQRLRVTVAYVGRLDRQERSRLDRFLEGAPELEVVAPRIDLSTAMRRATRPFRFARASHTPSTDPADIDGRAHSRTRRAFVQTCLEARRPRIVLVEFLRLTHTVHPRAATPLDAPRYWVDTHDLLSQRTERYRAAGLAIDREVTASDEAAALETYDAVLAIQEIEGARFRRLLSPGPPVLVVPHGLPMPKLPPERVPGHRRPIRLGFLAGRDESNRDGLDWFVAEVWPTIRSRFGPGVEVLVGGQLTRDWASNAEGVRVLGPVDSTEAFWSTIEIAINPVRVGSGLKIKNVEALAFGRALLTTATGGEGFEGASPHGLRIADGAGQWQSTLTDWLEHPESAAAVGRAGRVYAENHFSEEAAFEKLALRLAETCTDDRS